MANYSKYLFCLSAAFCLYYRRVVVYDSAQNGDAEVKALRLVVVLVLGLAGLFPRVAFSQLSPTRQHDLNGGSTNGSWHMATGTWSIYDGPGREDGLLYITGDVDNGNVWIRHIVSGEPGPALSDRCILDFEYLTAYGGSAETNVGVIDTVSAPTSITISPDNHVTNALKYSLNFAVKAHLDTLPWLLPGNYRLRIKPGSTAQLVGTVDFKYSPLNGDVRVTVLRASDNTPVSGVPVAYNVYNADRTIVYPTYTRKYTWTNSSGVALIQRAISISRSITVNHNFAGFNSGYNDQWNTVQGNVVGFQGSFASNYTVKVGPGAGSGTVSRGADDALTCGPGTHWSGEACVSDSDGATACASGYQWSGTGCVAGSGGAAACATGYHWSGTGCVSDSAGATACAPGYHWSGSACVADSGSTADNPAFYTKEFWINLLKSLFIPSDVTLSRWATIWERFAAWGPFGMAKALSTDYASHSEYGFSTEPVWTFRNPILKYDSATGNMVAAPEIVWDLRPELNRNAQPAGYAGFNRPAGHGSFMGSLVGQVRLAVGALVWVSAGYLLIFKVWPKIAL